MGNNISRNRFWLITGLETALIGVFFLFVPNFLGRGNLKELFNILDNTSISIVLIVVGTFTVINSAFEVEPNWHRANVFVLEFLWTFYAVVFIIYDFMGLSRSYLSLTSIFFLMLAVRIFLESLWGDRQYRREVSPRRENR